MPRIKHFIVLMLENRSFDHLFGFFPAPAGETIENLLALHSPSLKAALDWARMEESAASLEAVARRREPNPTCLSNNSPRSDDAGPAQL
jgi:Phosphoesterase family